MKRIVLFIVIILLITVYSQSDAGQDDDSGNIIPLQTSGGLRLVDVQPIAELPGISDVDHALLSPDGARLAWINGNAAICTYQFADETQHCFEQDDGRLTNLYWSPDSTRLAAHETIVFMYDPDVWVIDLQDESLVNLTDDTTTEADEDAALWDETFVWDGETLIFVRYDFDAEMVTLQRINADGSDLTQLADISTMHEERFHVRDIALSPDGSQLALISFENRPESNQLWIIDLASGEFERLAHQTDITTLGVPDWYVESDITRGDMLMWVEWSADGAAVIVGTENQLYNRQALSNTFKIDVATGDVQPFVDWTAVEEGVSIFESTADGNYSPALDRQIFSAWLPGYETLVYFSNDGKFSGISVVTPGQEPVRLLLEDAGKWHVVFDRYTPNSVGYGDGVARVAIKGLLLTFEMTDTEGVTTSLQ